MTRANLESSSPDPLIASFISPTKPRRSARRSLPAQSSPTKQTFELQIGDHISPRKLKVTVEASDLLETAPPAPVVRTTTVPLKGLSDTDDSKPGRRKAMGTPIPRRTRNSMGRLPASSESWDFQVNQNVDVTRRNTRSRSRSIKTREVPVVDGDAAESTHSLSTSSTDTARSTAKSDVLLARFSPTLGTPKQTGWSSPRNDKSPYIAIEPEADLSAEADPMDLDDFQGAPQDDTLIETNAFKFSMISVDSIPSMRKYSSPLQPEEHGSTTPRAVPAQDWTLTSFSSIPAETFTAATPRAPRTNPTIESLKAEMTTLENEFSSIASEIYEAATPGRMLARPPPTSVDRFSNREFSSVPPSVLLAATPARKKSDIELATISRPVAHPSVENDATESAIQTQSASRMPTPDETPSPAPQPSLDAESSQEPAAKTAGDSVHYPVLASSPPRRFTYTAHLRQRRSLNPSLATPSILFSSPKLPPLQPPALVRGTPAPNQRPALSPIARTGRLLQEMVAPLPSPKGGSQNLGSPFTSPIHPRKLDSMPMNGTDAGAEFKSAPLKPLSVDETSAFSASTYEDPFLAEANSEPSQFLQSPISDKSYKLDLPEKQALESTLNSLSISGSAMSWQEEKNAPIKIPLNDSTARAAEASGPTSLAEKIAAERAAVSQRIENAPENVVVISSDESSESNVTASEADTNDDYDHFEEDVWLAEARESSSILDVESQRPASTQVQEIPPEKSPGSVPVLDLQDRPRRSKLPSPWRQNSRRLRYSDEGRERESPQSGTLSVSATRKLSPKEVEEAELSLLPTSPAKIPQKMNFSPQRRDRFGKDNDSGLAALLGSSPSKPRMQLPTLQTNFPTTGHSFHRATTKNGENTDSYSEMMPSTQPSQPSVGSYPDSNADAEPDATKPRHGLSSPPKRFNHAALRAASPAKINSFNPRPRSSVLPSPQIESLQFRPAVRRSAAKTDENSIAPKLFAAKTVEPEARPEAPRELSSTTWSKDHWKLLHRLYKTISKEAVGDDYSNSKLLGTAFASPAGNGTDVTMEIEAWHLAIVDDFLRRVPGWDEAVIAQRLFAVIVGDQLREEKKERLARGENGMALERRKDEMKTLAQATRESGTSVPGEKKGWLASVGLA